MKLIDELFEMYRDKLTGDEEGLGYDYLCSA